MHVQNACLPRQQACTTRARRPVAATQCPPRPPWSSHLAWRTGAAPGWWAAHAGWGHPAAGWRPGGGPAPAAGSAPRAPAHSSACSAAPGAGRPQQGQWQGAAASLSAPPLGWLQLQHRAGGTAGSPHPGAPAVPHRHRHARVAGQQKVLPNRLQVWVQAAVVGGEAGRHAPLHPAVEEAERRRRRRRLVPAQRAGRGDAAALAGPAAGLVVCGCRGVGPGQVWRCAMLNCAVPCTFRGLPSKPLAHLTA